jgi:hypothetical protein
MEGNLAQKEVDDFEKRKIVVAQCSVECDLQISSQNAWRMKQCVWDDRCRSVMEDPKCHVGCYDVFGAVILLQFRHMCVYCVVLLHMLLIE